MFSELIGNFRSNVFKYSTGCHYVSDSHTKRFYIIQEMIPLLKGFCNYRPIELAEGTVIYEVRRFGMLL